MFLPINQADFSKVTAIWNEGFSDYLIPIHMTESQLNHRFSSLNISKEDSCVLVKNNEYVGIILLAHTTRQNKKIMWVGGMAISPKFRHQGLSKNLMTYAINLAKKKNCHSLNLEVITTNDKAYHLYSQLGFKKVNELTNGHLISHFNTEISHPHLHLQKGTSKIFEQKEPQTIPWQNRLIFCQQTFTIKQENTIIGYISGRETEESFIIQQLVFFNKNNEQLLDSTLLALYKTLKKELQYSNLVSNSFKKQDLINFSPQQTINQFQMALKIY